MVPLRAAWRRRSTSTPDGPEGMNEYGDDYTTKADLILKNCLRHVDMDMPLLHAVYPLALDGLVRDIRAMPDDFVLGRIGPEPAPLPAEPAAPPSPRELVRSLELPAAPLIVGRLNQAMAGDKASPDELAAIIRLDPTLAANLLRLVNSPLYSPAAPVQSISRAVVMLGTRQLYSLAIGDVMARLASGLAPRDMDMDAFWEHSVACAVVARMLAELTGGADPEVLFVSGLLHDIGRLALAAGLRDQSRAITHAAGARRIPKAWAETEILGYDHAYLGGGLLRTWSIPESIVQGVGFHHAPLKAKSRLAACIVHTADVLAQLLVIKPNALTYCAPLSAEAVAALALDPERAAETLRGLDDLVAETLAVLFAKEGEAEDGRKS